LPSDKPERRLEDIIENAQAIDMAPTLMPGQPWQEIRALGNRLRHEYDAIREDRLWDIVQIDLPPLCAACEDALYRLRKGQGNQ
jgi:uncharacterized protein with HEPN domain